MDYYQDTLQRKSKCEIPNQYFIGNRMLTNSDEIANEFYNYCVNIELLLSEQITSPHTSEGQMSRLNFHR